MATQYIGLDFEASGAEPWGRSVPIEIGLAVGNEVYTSLIGQWSWAEFDWNDKAAEVHGIDQSDLFAARPVWQVDILAAAWLMERWVTPRSNRMFNITVGWNVAGYDRQFVTRWMPSLNRLLSYRTADLNAMVFALAGDSEPEYDAIKKMAKEYAEAEGMIGNPLPPELAKPHRAGYDARMSLISFEYLQHRMGR